MFKKRNNIIPMVEEESSPSSSRNNSGDISETLELKSTAELLQKRDKASRYKKIGKFYKYEFEKKIYKLYISIFLRFKNFQLNYNKFSQKIQLIGNLLRVENKLFRCFLAEVLGTCVFISFGLASVAQYVFVGKISFLSVNISFGFGLTMGIIVSGKISGSIFFSCYIYERYAQFTTFGILFIQFLIVGICSTRSIIQKSK